MARFLLVRDDRPCAALRRELVSSYNLVLTASNRLYAPGAGAALDATTRIVRPKHCKAWCSSVVAYDAARRLSTLLCLSIPADRRCCGQHLFGFVVTGTNPANLQSGIARVTPTGTGTWVSAASAAQDTRHRQGRHQQRTRVVQRWPLLYVLFGDAPRPGFIGGGRLGA